MLTLKALNELLDGVYHELVAGGLQPDRMILFGPYAKENVHQYSDVDIAIWNKKFIGEGMIDFELIQPTLQQFSTSSLNHFNTSELPPIPSISSSNTPCHPPPSLRNKSQ